MDVSVHCCDEKEELGDNRFAMHHIRLKLQQVIAVFGQEYRAADFITGKLPDAFKAVPRSHGVEVHPVTFGSAPDLHTQVSGNPLVIFHTHFEQVGHVSVCFGGRRFAVPYPCNYCLHSTTIELLNIARLLLLIKPLAGPETFAVLCLIIQPEFFYES